MNMERKVVELDLNDVLPNRFQPRIKFSEDSINDLAESIKEHGVIQPIVVRSIGDKYEIIAGERRYKASILAGKVTIPAIVTELNDKDSAEVALIENVQRKDLTPIEEAISYKKILDMGYLTQEELASKLGRTQSTIANKLRLLNLDDEVQEALLNEQISERHARSLLRLNDSNLQRNLLKKVIEDRLTVRRTDEEIDKMLNGNNNEVEFLNFESNDMAPVESVPEVAIPEMNIPTSPIIGDTIPEVSLPDYNAIPAEPVIPEMPIFNDNLNEVNSTNTLGDEFLNTQNFNIPVAPIVESVPEEIAVVDAHDNDSLNPGFMNIEQIETQAEDIYQPKPLANVESLLEPSSIIQPVPLNPIDSLANETSTEDESDDDANILVPGKFFNIMKEETEEVSAPSSIGLNQPELFNFDMNLASTPQVLPSFDQSMPVVTPMEDNFVNSVETFEEAPVVSSVNNTDVIQSDYSFVEPDYNFGQNLESYTSVDSVPALSSEDVLSTSTPIVSVVEDLGIPDSMEEKNLKSVIDIVRECASRIEKLGYVLETEEFDFEDIYQVIFKINK